MLSPVSYESVYTARQFDVVLDEDDPNGIAAVLTPTDGSHGRVGKGDLLVPDDLDEPVLRVVWSRRAVEGPSHPVRVEFVDMPTADGDDE